MTHSQLVEKLREIIETHGGRTYPAVHIFGIVYADELKSQNLSTLCDDAGISKNYRTEISKGRKLAPYVTVK